jgi:peptidoglycan/xylan/chitin deacetylase (PgdA/CDA1 family)
LEPREPFERAIWNVKMNTPLFKKYIEGGVAVVSGSGIADLNKIILKGECLIDGNEFRVSYDLLNAVQSSNNLFHIPFSMENITDGLSHFDEFFLNPTEDEAGILLSFDDDHWHIWREYFDVFDRYDAKVTFFVQGSMRSEGLADFCAEALSRGHDLGFHSVNHHDLTKVSRETFNAETIHAAEAFSKAGIPFSAFAFPYGFSQPWMREALVPFFPLIRDYGANTRFYDSNVFANQYLISKAVDNIVYPDDSKFENDVRLMLLAVKLSGYFIVPLTAHDISDTGRWAIKPKRLEFLLKTAQELKLKFYTYSNHQ